MTMQEMNSIVIPETLTGTVTKSLNILRKQESRKKQKRVYWTVGSLAAAAVLVIAVSTAYPAIAENIPFLHGIFAEKQESFIAPGDYAEHASTLNPVEPTLTQVPAQTAEVSGTEVSSVPAEPAEEKTITAEEYIVGKQYAVADNGVAIIPSEVYCDGVSVYLSVEIYLEKTVQELCGREDVAGGMSYLTLGSIRVDDKAANAVNSDYDNSLVDDHRFFGMLKIDVSKSDILEGEEHVLSGGISTILADLSDSSGRLIENEKSVADTSFFIHGNWKLEIPFTTSSEEMRVFTGLNPDGLTNAVYEVRVSPYQVLVKYKKQNTDAECVVFDENGEHLDLANNKYGAGNDTFALDGKTPEKLYIYIVDTVVGDSWIPSPKIHDRETAEQYKLTMLELDLTKN